MMYDRFDNASETRYEMDFANQNPVPRCAVMLVLDTSHSMWGQGLADMMMSLKTFYRKITAAQFLHAQVDVAAVSMGDRLGVLEKFTPLADSDLPERAIRPKGDTPIGAALELALETLQTQLRQYRDNGISCVTPHLILLSDGKSTDDFLPVADKIRELDRSGKLICRAIALGNDADMANLARIAGENRVMTPLRGGIQESFSRVGEIVSQTYEEEAQEVIAEQSVPLEKHHETEYLLDGSNILHWDEYRDGITLKYLLAITDHLKQSKQSFRVFFDATAPYILKKNAPQDAITYKTLLKNDPEHFLQVPAGTRADDFLLLQADINKNALILTQDLFRDHVDKYPWIKSEKRIIPGMVMNHLIFFPEISLQITLPEPEKSGNGNL